jgi:hypothetical protein
MKRNWKKVVGVLAWLIAWGTLISFIPLQP